MSSHRKQASHSERAGASEPRERSGAQGSPRESASGGRGGDEVPPHGDPLRVAVTRVVESYGLDLFDLQFRRESIGWVLRVVLDRPWTPQASEGTTTGDQAVIGVAEEPVGVSDCSRVSQDLSAILDVEPELIGGLDRTYTLEVSSPGLDRPLRDARDYRRFTGRLAKIVTQAPIDGQASFAGRLAGLDGDTVLLEEGRRTHRVPMSAIRRARLEVEF